VRCSRAAVREEAPGLYCREHAAELRAALPLPGRDLARDRDALRITIQQVLARLHEVGTVALAQTLRISAVDAARKIDDVLQRQFRQEEDGHHFLPGEGLPAFVLIPLSLQWLADTTQVAMFPGPVQSYTSVQNGLTELLRQTETILAAPAFMALVSDQVTERRAALRLHALLREAVCLLPAFAVRDAEAGSTRPKQINSDAAVVLLAGCWWLATGRWPPKNKAMFGAFSDWARAVFLDIRPDLAAAVTSEGAVRKALWRQRHVTGAGGGPWLALDIGNSETQP
jgi:hypothetical protein